MQSDHELVDFQLASNFWISYVVLLSTLHMNFHVNISGSLVYISGIDLMDQMVTLCFFSRLVQMFFKLTAPSRGPIDTCEEPIPTALF